MLSPIFLIIDARILRQPKNPQGQSVTKANLLRYELRHDCAKGILEGCIGVLRALCNK